MALPRMDVAKKIEQAAQDLMDYLRTYSSPEHKLALYTKLVGILNSAKEDYSGVNLSYFRQFAMKLIGSRQRLETLDDAIKAVNNKPGDLFGCFVIIVDLLSHGNCETTSLNTSLLNQLLEATGKYKPIYEEEKGVAKSNTDDVTTTWRLKNTFLEKATAYLKQKEVEEKKEEARKAAEVKAAQPQLRRLKIPQELIADLNRILQYKPNSREVHKMDAKELAEKHAMLSTALDKRRKALVPEDKKPKIEEKEVLVPLACNYEETVTMSIDAPVKRDPEKLSKNKAYADVLDTIGGLFAKRYEKKKPAAEPSVIAVLS